MAFQHLATHFLFGINALTNLIEEKLKAISFKQIFVVRRVVIHAIQGRLKSFYHQPPPAVSFTKIYGTVHCFYALLEKPMFGYVKQHVGSILIVDAIEKAKATNTCIITFVPVFFIG